MPSFNPFNSVKGKNAFTLFEIRLDNDFIVFRGSEQESSGQLLKGVVVLCLPAPLKVDDVHLRLTGTLRMAWTDSRVTATGISSQKVDRTRTVVSHKWPAFVGGGSPGSSRSVTLREGNYEWPFELMLPGDTCESVEGMQEANITYKLKATVARGKLAYDLHTYKRLRAIRTLESSALEFLHTMSVENIWPNKVEYSIVIPQKAVVFGSTIPLESRFTPLLKGLELGDISIKLIEIHEVIMQSVTGQSVREHKKEREAASWTIPMSREKHWQDMIEDTGQEGWVLKSRLDLPKKLGKCMQDVNAQGIKIRHKLKMIVALKNPDGHISELRATLPVTIFISPNMPLDEDGNLVHQLPNGAGADDSGTRAPPGYGEHVLDQLYDELNLVGLQTPGMQSGVNSPYYSHSQVSSSEDLSATAADTAIPPAVLVSRLQDMPRDPSHRRISSNQSQSSGSGGITPYDGQTGPASGSASQPQSAPLSRHNSEGSATSHSGSDTPEHIDYPDLAELNKVPSYQTAVKTPARSLFSFVDGLVLPDYRTAMRASRSASMSAPVTPSPESSPSADPFTLAIIPEVSHELAAQQQLRSAEVGGRPPISRRRQTAIGLSSLLGAAVSGHHVGEMDERRRLHLIQARERVV